MLGKNMQAQYIQLYFGHLRKVKTTTWTPHEILSALFWWRTNYWHSASQHGDGANYCLPGPMLPVMQVAGCCNSATLAVSVAMSWKKGLTKTRSAGERERVHNARYKARNKICFFWSSTRGKWNERWGNENTVIQLRTAKRLREFKYNYSKARPICNAKPGRSLGVDWTYSMHGGGKKGDVSETRFWPFCSNHTTVWSSFQQTLLERRMLIEVFPASYLLHAEILLT
jgi:hypothetical protein